MSTSTSATNTISGDAWKHIREAIESLKFGTVEITVHESRIVQVERKEKLRFTAR